MSSGELVTADALTDKQQAFVRQYLVDFNATAAAIRAGYSARSARNTGYELLANARVQAALSEAKAPVFARLEVSAERTISELVAIAYGNVTDLCSWDDEGVHFLPSDQLRPEHRPIVGKVTVKRRREVRGRGDDATEFEVEEQSVEPRDKLGALRELARLQGLVPRDLGRGQAPEEAPATSIDMLGMALRGLIDGSIPPQHAAALATVAKAIGDVREKEEYEERLRKLEEQLEARTV